MEKIKAFDETENPEKKTSLQAQALNTPG